MAAKKIKSTRNTREVMIEQLKKKLILANRILESEKLASPFGHVSVRIPDTDTFLITRSVAPGMATKNDILVCDMDGKILQGKYDDTYSEVVIHTAVYKKRGEFDSVVHSHSPHVIALSLAGLTVLPVNLQATIVGLEPIALYQKMVFIDSPESGEEVAELLGPNKAVILKGHGAVVVGKSIEDAIWTARILETSAMFQWMARSVGALGSITEQEKQWLMEYFKRTERTGHGSLREWNYYESKLRL
jgi:HCOMODA/2-hydroxy-3-carboxy-muconic semialdehyde decarboxylase